MANETPNPQSFEQLESDMLSAYAAKLGINDFLVGSAVTAFFEVVALMVARSSGDIFQVLRDFSVDRATGDALKRLARDNRVPLITARPTTGYVTVTDTSFEKISTKVYAGANPPNIGSVQIRVSDASEFPATGSIYIGRGTPNVEGPLAYSSITPTGGYYIINLSAPTTKFHNVGEAVILSQGGNRTVPANTVALSPSTGASPDIQFGVVTAAVILDGETTVENVQVSALIPGANGNVPRGAVKEFAAAPFPGATVTNPLPFTNGADNETDDELRVRIKRALASTGLGTATVVKSAVIGATPIDEQATIVSTSLISVSYGSILFIDDGKGYEAKTAGVGLESIVDFALGGERFFQLATGGRQAPVAKAFLESTFAGPYDLTGGDTLSITVGETTYEHTFDISDFRSPGGATAYEASASINANTALGFEATTSEGGQYVVIRAKEEGNDTVKTATPSTSGRNAAVLLGLPSNEIQTLRLYKNKIPLNKDGKTASIFTQNQQLWSNSIQTGDTLVLSVDGTDAITYTFTDSDFIETGLFTTVSATNSLDSWVEVFNNKLTGVTASIVGQQIKITSNLGTNNRAEVIIEDTSTLVTKGMFSLLVGLSSQGKASDFTLDRNTAQFELTVALEEGDQLSAGSDQTEARIQSEVISGGTVTLSGDGHVWMLIDTVGSIINTGVTGNTLLSVTKPSTNVIRYTSSVPSCFTNVLLGDYVVVWSNELNAANRIEGRVNAVTATTLDILITATEWATVTPEANVVFSEGFTVLRTALAPQKFRVTSGTKTLDQIAIELQDQTNSLIFTVQEEQYLVIRSRTKDVDGRVLIVTSDFYGKLLNLPSNSSDVSKDSLIAFYESESKEGEFPLFIHAGFASGTAADPIDSYISSFVSATSLASRDPNELIATLHPYGVVGDAQPYGEITQETSITGGTTIGIVENPYLRRLRTVDRYFIANPLDFGYNDTAVVILDNDPSGKAFEIPFYRRAVTNTSLVNNPSNFNAYDVDSGATADFDVAFNGFDFSNFKVLLQAKKTLKHTNPQTALLYRSTRWGRSGEKINVGYIYPSSADQDINSVITVDTNVNVRISLKSGPSVPSAIDNTTEWNISVTPNTPVAGIDQVTFDYSGVGTAPNLSLAGGEYVNITGQTEFDKANVGIFRVSDEAGFLPSATSFSVQMPTGQAVAESAKSTLVNGAITFYEADPTTAAEINTYVNAELTRYFSTTIVNDGGTSGSGVIDKSTYEDSAFTYESVFLFDGINWLQSSNLSGSPEFTFKVPLALDSDVGYAFNDGEEIRFIPTTMDQVRRLISVLAVTGFTTLGSVGVVDRGTKLELSTNILGSDGSIQVSGGAANSYEVPVSDSATRIDNSFMSVSVDRISSQFMHSDQWFKLQAEFAQRKETGFFSNTTISTFNNTPVVGQTTIVMGGRTLNQRYFGSYRNFVRTRGLTFRVEKQGKFACLSWNNVGTNPSFIKGLNLNDTGGGTFNASKVPNSNEIDFTILTGDANFTEVSIGDQFLVNASAVPENDGTFIVTGVSDDGKTVRVLNPNSANSFSSGTFTFTGNSTAGDSFTIGANTLIADTDFAIGGTQQDTANNLAVVIGSLPGVNAVANGSVVTVTATSPNASIALGYSGTAVVTVSGAFLVGETYNAGTFHSIGQISEGDTLVLDAPFHVLNRGKFRVIRRYATSVWYENDNIIEEEVALVDNLISLGFDGTTSFDVDASSGLMVLEWNGGGTQPDFDLVNMGDVMRFGTDFAVANRGDFMVVDVTSTTITCINPSAVSEASIEISNVLQCHRPQMQFAEYEATVVGDKFVITGNIIGAASAGTYEVIRAASRTSIIIDAALASVSNVSMNNRETAIYVEEDLPYSGYKHVSFVSQQPGADDRNLVVFDTNAQYSKINESGVVQISPQNKMNFPTTVRQGLDSYRYNTGLIAEANRIIYGDPRDPATYPGVGAAGAEIFTREPLTRRIQISIVIRTLTGVPFTQTVEQVRTSISSLINSNPVGESIAISAIISAVNAIPGIRAVSIDSPQYDTTHDIIFVAPSEKARILDPSLDIFVSQVGS